jgi:hypothetical protein
MLQTASADTKKATARGNSQPQAAPDGLLLAPPVPALGNQATLRLMRKCDCGGAPDCDCDMGADKKKKEKDAPRTALHRKASGSGALLSSALLDRDSQSFFEARSQHKASSQAAAPAVPRIEIGAVDDPLEAEANSTAERVMRMPRSVPPSAAASTKGSDPGDNKLHRQAVGAGPSAAPDIVHEVLRSQGQPLPSDVRSDMEARMGHNFADVSLHTDERAGASAETVAAQAYTVGRHIVFAPGRFDPASTAGRRLLAHELAHAAGHPSGLPAPAGDLRISTPAEPAEQHAVAVSEGSAGSAESPAAPPGLFRQAAGIVGLTGVTVNQPRATVPPEAGLSLKANISPANAPGVTLSIVGNNAAIDPGTTVNNADGTITVAATQTGGTAHVEATQNATGPGGATLTSTAPSTAPLTFTASPSGITSTTSSPRGVRGFYGGDFTHTFTSPAGGQTALERSHVNEQFAAATGTNLKLTGPLATVNVAVNNPEAPTSGWDLDSSGTMVAPDHVDWGNTADARPFVANASRPSPSPGLPQDLTATQDFRNLSFPSKKYGAAVTSTTHRRAIEDRGNKLQAVTSAGINSEVVEDYAGPTVFRRCTANPTSIPVTAPPPPKGKTPTAPGAKAPAVTTSTITVDAEGQPAKPKFSINQPDLGCKISIGGVLTPGNTAGKVTVRAGNTVNFDETTVTLIPLPTAPPPTTTPPTSPPASPPASPTPTLPAPTQNPNPNPKP